jgi:hypothetical protein
MFFKQEQQRAPGVFNTVGERPGRIFQGIRNENAPFVLPDVGNRDDCVSGGASPIVDWC